MSPQWLTLLLLFTTAFAMPSITGQITGCRNGTIPFLGECSGRGVCINDTCVCDEGWTGLSIWFDHRGRDCQTNYLAFKITQIIGYVFHMICILIVCGRLVKLGKLPTSRWQPHQSGRRRVQLLLLCHLFTSITLLVQFGLNAIGEHYTSNSWISAIVMIVCAVATAIDSTVQAQFFADVSLTKAGTAAQRIRPRVLILVYTQQSLSVLMWTACCLGIAVAPTSDIQLYFTYALQIGVALLVVSPALVHAKFMKDAMTGMLTHMEELERRRQNTEVIKSIYAKVEKARGNSVTPAIVALISILLMLILISLSPYVGAIMWSLTAVRLSLDSIIYAPDDYASSSSPTTSQTASISNSSGTYSHGTASQGSQAWSSTANANISTTEDL